MGMFLICWDWESYWSWRNNWLTQIPLHVAGEHLPICYNPISWENLIFQHYTDPNHKAKATLEWLKNRRVNVLERWGQSPDLNTIENPWQYLKTAVQRCCSTNLEDLCEFCQEEWGNNLSFTMCKTGTYCIYLKCIQTAKRFSAKY